MRLKRRAAVSVEYALLSAFIGTAIIASIAYLKTSSTNYFTSWGGTKAQKVQYQSVLDHHKGTTTNTGSPTPQSGTSNLMNKLGNYGGPLVLPTPVSGLAQKPLSAKPLKEDLAINEVKPIEEEVAPDEVKQLKDDIVPLQQKALLLNK